MTEQPIQSNCYKVTNEMKITFIGAGNMASSLAGGLIAKGFDAAQITLADISEAQLQAARTTLGVNT